MKKKNNTAPSFWITPQENIFETPIIKLISKLTHRRCISGKISPYKDQSSLTRLKSVIKLTTRHQSPKIIKNKKSSPSKRDSPSKIKAKPPLHTSKRTIKKSKSIPVNKLHQLEGKDHVKAPKIFENQIFRDVYDEAGNHDRVMDTIDISITLPEIVNEKDLTYESLLIIPKDIELKLKEYDSTEHILSIKQPENSYLQETKDKIKVDNAELFKKLQKLAIEQESF